MRGIWFVLLAVGTRLRIGPLWRTGVGPVFSARLVGDALNITTPTASVGGEAVKAWLVRSHVPLTESLPSVLIANTTITIGQTLLLLFGIAVAGPILAAGPPLLRGMQVLGATDRVGRLLQRLGLLRAEDREPVLRQIDRAFVLWALLVFESWRTHCLGEGALV